MPGARSSCFTFIPFGGCLPTLVMQGLIMRWMALPMGVWESWWEERLGKSFCAGTWFPAAFWSLGCYGNKPRPPCWIMSVFAFNQPSPQTSGWLQLHEGCSLRPEELLRLAGPQLPSWNHDVISTGWFQLLYLRSFTEGTGRANGNYSFSNEDTIGLRA